MLKCLKPPVFYSILPHSSLSMKLRDVKRLLSTGILNFTFPQTLTVNLLDEIFSNNVKAGAV
jgi:hypothetical protein